MTSEQRKVKFPIKSEHNKTSIHLLILTDLEV